jgi:UDP-N-acetylmuramoyl-tripeptide--D-alanyl-D-alanine ligase
MLELGSHADQEHAALGALAASSGIDLVVTVGTGAERVAEGARAAATSHPTGRSDAAVVTVPDAAAAADFVVGEARAGDAVLVKASRAVGLESVADALVRGVSA